MASKKFSAVLAIGGTVSASLGSAFRQVTQNTTQLGSTVANLTRQQRLLGDAVQTFGRQGRSVDSLRVRYASVTAELERQRAQLGRIAQIESARAANAARRVELRSKIGETIAAAAVVAGPVSQAVKFENAMLGVAKQVEGARDASGKLTSVYTEMGAAIQRLARETPMAANSLAEMVTAGARMGVGKDMDPKRARETLLQFTKISAMMAEAFEADPAELADQMGKIAGLYKTPIPAISELGDTINYLDDNAISKGSEIIDFLTRTGGVAGAVKVTAKEMAALGSTLLTLGERPETAATATNAIFQKFAAAEKGTKKFKAALSEAGLSASELQAGMQKDAQGTLLHVLEKINKLPKDKQLGVMVELVGLEHSDTLAKLASGTEEYRKQIQLTNSEAAKGSMQREFAARLETTSAQAKIAGNKLTELAVTIGSVLLPPINAMLTPLGDTVTKIAEFARQNPLVTQSIVGVVAGLAALKVGMLAGSFAATIVSDAWLLFKGGAVRLIPVLRAVGTGLLFVGRAALANPIGAVVTALALGAVMLMQNWEPVSAFFTKTWTSVRSSFAETYEWIVGRAAKLMALPGELAARLKGVFGFDEGSRAPAASPALPELPPQAARGNTQYHVTVNQAPGQSPAATAAAVAQRLGAPRAMGAQLHD